MTNKFLEIVTDFLEIYGWGVGVLFFVLVVWYIERPCGGKQPNPQEKPQSETEIPR